MYLRVNGTHAFSDTQVIYWERKKSFVELAITNELTLYILHWLTAESTLHMRALCYIMN